MGDSTTLLIRLGRIWLNRNIPWKEYSLLTNETMKQWSNKNTVYGLTQIKTQMQKESSPGGIVM